MYGVGYDGRIGRRIVRAPFSRPNIRKHLKVRLNPTGLGVGEPLSNNSFVRIVTTLDREKRINDLQKRITYWHVFYIVNWAWIEAISG